MEVDFHGSIWEGKHRNLPFLSSGDFWESVELISSPMRSDFCFQLQLASWATSGKSLALSEPWFPPKYNGLD